VNRFLVSGSFIPTLFFFGTIFFTIPEKGTASPPVTTPTERKKQKRKIIAEKLNLDYLATLSSCLK
jgi:hypothetical protein